MNWWDDSNKIFRESEETRRKNRLSIEYDKWIDGVFKKYDFTKVANDRDQHWHMYNYGYDYASIREYAIPECIGCMMKVKYVISFHEKYAGDGEMEFKAIAFNKPYGKDYKLEENEACILLGEDSLKVEAFRFNEEKYFGWIEHDIGVCIENVIELAEKRLKNVFHMERVG